MKAARQGTGLVALEFKHDANDRMIARRFMMRISFVVVRVALCRGSSPEFLRASATKMSCGILLMMTPMSCSFANDSEKCPRCDEVRIETPHQSVLDFKLLSSRPL